MISVVSLAFAIPVEDAQPMASITRTVMGTDETLTLYSDRTNTVPVTGGQRADPDEWPDAVAVVFDSAYVGCTGTLVAPDVVITAAHCAGGISHVIVGTRNIVSDQGELIEVVSTDVHWSYEPGTLRGLDLAVLKLRNPSTFPHRVIASDCVIDEELMDGVDVTIVGFGTTDENGNVPTNFQLEGEHRVRDHDCSEDALNGRLTGCDPALRPGGEIIAGGQGVDACTGDSGGPLYLHTSRGTFVVGATSRAMIGVDILCGQGGIWARPDSALNFIQNRGGITLDRPLCNDAPTAEIDDIEVDAGESGEAEIVFEDTESDSFTAEVLEGTDLGSVDVDGGSVVFTADSDAAGSDTVIIRVTDAGNPDYANGPPLSVDVEIDLRVKERASALGGCACSGPGSSPEVPLIIGLFGFLLTRRKKSL